MSTQPVISEKPLFINGEWVQAHGETLTKTNPANQQILWQGQSANAQDIAHACQVAHQAFPSWAKMPVAERIAVAERFAKLLEDNKTRLAEIISQETSKPHWETLTEVASMMGKVAISVKAYHDRTGEHATAMVDATATLRHRPHGVMAVFGPYNFPGHLPNGHIVPALIAGNTIVFKPSELTPWTAEETVKLWQQAGLPKGVLNLVQGGRDTGIALSQSDDIDGLLFTGSANTGYALHRQLAGKPEKMLALEMGGNNALIVDELDSPEQMDAAVNLTIQSAFISAGQRCTCARRLLVKTGKSGDDFIARLVDVAKNLVVGDWNTEPQPFMGGVISLKASQDMLNAQQQLIDNGAKPLLTMARVRDNSSLLSPAILDVTGVKNIADEEHFGPLLVIYRYNDFDEALKIANNTKFGLSVGLISPKRALFDRLLNEAKAGIVNWNKPLTGASSAAPFGGIGASGNHRPSAYYAADYCAWAMASLESEHLALPEKLSPGLVIK